jgi:hypothetical protein
MGDDRLRYAPSISCGSDTDLAERRLEHLCEALIYVDPLHECGRHVANVLQLE